MTRSTLLWLRRDLRLRDNPALRAAIDRGGPVIPVFVLDPETQAWGAAPRWRLGRGLAAFARALEERGSRLVLRRGEAAAALSALARETGAGALAYSRLYDAASRERDARVEAAMAEAGVATEAHCGTLLRHPWEIETKAGGFYKVFGPYWRAVRERPVASPLPAPARLPAPERWPASDRLEDWALGRDMNRGAAVVARHARIGEAAAEARLETFLESRAESYATGRDRIDRDATSGLSEPLTYGEISPRLIWDRASRALERGVEGARTFLQELVWREFAHHLLWHTPHIEAENWSPRWRGFPWRDDNDAAERWRRGLTGEPIVDAAMRELFVTGRMHNRARMLVGSYLCKHLMTHWKIGEAWFRDCLTDWDRANNALGWQWIAGSGPDATPFFRVFNPGTQAEKFDPDGAYRRRWVAELSEAPGADALAFFEAAPRAWGLSPDRPYPAPLVDLKQGRERALEAYRRARAG